jgi:putative transposase
MPSTVPSVALLFSTRKGDYRAFLQVLREARQWRPVRLLAYCLMPNHWHLLVWPEHDGDLSDFLRWLTVTHTQRYHAHYQSAGTGPLYQGRFKSFPVQEDDHLTTVWRYVERNALRAHLVPQAQDWRWTSLWQRAHEAESGLLDAGPVALPPDWADHVNAPQTEAELDAVRRCVLRGCPYGDGNWTKATVAQLGLESTVRPRGRPRKQRPTEPR